MERDSPAANPDKIEGQEDQNLIEEDDANSNNDFE